ncbi:beta-ketoadipate enol-lactone hydrolase [Deinococcus sp. RL]|uniref:alpha/beta fold hydrolase n=1 Tax=Deinococcus sp. RL TaxID=1489678 RepID=UPI0004DAF7FD|nr:alpha/beta hydrolase [Deinococcus sp. RL]KEF33406.1 beta-ketoadipate enol-lactone hydrolase [Deinococcus sp. RL]
MTAPHAPRTVLLLHAYPLSAAMWDDQRAALEEAGFTVIAPNLPGFGGEAGAITTLEDAARDLLAALPQGEPLAVVGLSMGGYLTLELLRQAPERFARVVLADTTLRADPPEKAEDRREQADRVEAEGAGFIVAAAEKEHSPATFRRVRPMIEAASREGIAGALRAMAVRGEGRDALRGLAVPLLVLVGEADDITPVEYAQELADAGRGELRVLPGAAHLSNLDNPAAFNAALLEFLS